MLDIFSFIPKNNIYNIDDDGTKRNFSLDNIRFILMLLVVYAHLLEIASPFMGSELIYKVIYSFHMPVFIFCLVIFQNIVPKELYLIGLFHILYFKVYIFSFLGIFLK